MFKLYYWPGAVSLVTHIALEESGLPYSLQHVALHEGEQHGAAYKQIHPLSRVPALELAPGQVLTETPALLWYLAELAPELALLPASGLARARATEWMSFFSSALHVAFITFYRPDRYADDAEARKSLSADGKARFAQLLAYVESRLGGSTFLLGSEYTLCDAYALVFYLWGRRVQLELGELARYGRLAKAVLERPATRRALEQEGLGAALPAVLAGH
jgi:glutathione S-transferase